ncbi:gluconate:H+ symporter [Chromohalobacter sp. 48-RD10]|uniref:GntP family permease n=1 Tax=Chromohalobacter sp. 48-RD10 TaxID=2994063 RepID=UPI0024683D85|nr:gluconate:H+ symporter [Chromohalobacter sp. 48-RD10]
MLTGSALIAVFICALITLFVLILFLRWEAYIALLVVAVATGVIAGVPLEKIPDTITSGFGSTLGGVGILIGLGIILGQLMEHAGAINRIAQALLRLFGPRQATSAVAGTGLVVGIPLFFDAAFVILNGIIRRLSSRTGHAYSKLVLSLSVGLITAYCFVIPTPAPLLVVDQLKVDIGAFFIYGLIVATPAIAVAALVYGPIISRNEAPLPPDDAATDAKDASTHRRPISTFLSFFVIGLPIGLILLNTMFGFALPNSPLTPFFAFVGDKNMALLISVIFAAIVLRPYMSTKPHQAYVEAFQSAGLILLITGAGGSFGAIVKTTGIGDDLIHLMQNWQMPLLLLGFLFAQTLRVALGSSTVALITTASIIGPSAVSLDISPILLGLAICSGGIGLSMPNDSGFWVVSRFSGMTVRQTLKTWTAGGFVAGLTGLAMVYILSLLAPVLPGL